ncbi:hypothetical protein [Hydrogenophaga sp. OTU3427]|uniref:hypothetical protein n=1 Tax=Hydrogenophaga sp. OTU3427 TaxID=3043856 RepID=UPI00313EA3D2
MTTASTELDTLSQGLLALRAGHLRVADWSAQARGQQTLLDALPPRYGEVLLGLLDRLESSALFAEESCSFSQVDLFDSLQMWLDKARAQLAR